MSCPAYHSNSAKNKPRPPAVHPPEHLRLLQRACRSKAGAAGAPPPSHGKLLRFAELTNVAPKRRGYLGSSGGGCGGRGVGGGGGDVSWREEETANKADRSPPGKKSHSPKAAQGWVRLGGGHRVAEPQNATYSSLPSGRASLGPVVHTQGGCFPGRRPVLSLQPRHRSQDWEPGGWALVPALPPALGMT